MGARESEDEADSSSSEEEEPSTSESEPSAASDSDSESQGDADEEEEDAAQSSDGEEMEEEAAGGCGAAGGDADDTAAVEASEADVPEPTQQQLEDRRQQNIQALVSGAGLALQRQALLPRLLTVQQAAVVLRRAFKSPHPDAPAVSEALKRKLAARKSFVPWGGGKFVPLQLKMPPREPLLLEEVGPVAPAPAPAAGPPPVVLPPGIEPLVLWEPPAGAEGQPVLVDDMLTQWLRPHQREGVQFMFECVTGLRGFEGQGCILADDMGLGKTLQGISLLWTLLTAPGHALLGGQPLARRVIICCPTSLVGNWDSECGKWLKGRVRTLPLCESGRDEAAAAITQFLSPRNPYQVMIVSYETFRIHAERFRAEGTCDLLICDEAHRLKNDATLTNRALDSLACRRRVLLSGTPLQNRLDEFYAMVSFCNPGVLGTPAQFRRHFEAPILAGREPDASDEAAQLCQERTAELSGLVNDFILRRTNTLLSQHLPPKVVEIVCCRMTPLQLALYCHFLESKATRSLFAAQKAARVLSAITSLRKLLNHPKLIYDALHSNTGALKEGKEAEGFEGCSSFFPPGMFGGGRTGRGGMPPGWEQMSGKFAVLANMLDLLRRCTRDRIVIVSNYTQTLDLVGQLCRDRAYPFVRLDGTTTIKKRNKLVQDFNNPALSQFAFLLSSKAGGCGLNLIGGNRLVLFDPSWNPADDKQAAARVWRDGQQKKVYVYRFMATGTIEEKVYQRQLSKEGLQQVVDTAKASGGGGGSAGGKASGGGSGSGGKAGTGSNLMSTDELRDLFSYDPDTLSTTYDSMCCQRPPAAAKPDGGGRGGGRGRGRGGKAQAGRGRGRGAGSGGKKRPRQQDWSSSSSSDASSSSDDGSSSDEDERRPPPPPPQQQQQQQDSDIVISDSDDDMPAAGGAAQRPGSAAASGRQDSGSWSSDSASDSEADADMAPADQQPAEAAEARQQGPAQPAPMPQQQEGQPPPAAVGSPAADGNKQQPQQQQQQQQPSQQLLPSAAVMAAGGAINKQQVGKPGEEQLRLWGHHSTTATVPDQVMQQIGDEHISFVFSLQVDGKAIDPEPPLAPLAQQLVGAAGGQQRRPGALGGARPMVAMAGGTAAAAAAAGRPAAVQQQQAGPSRPAVQQQQPMQQPQQPRQPPPQPPPQQASVAPAAKENAVANQAAAGPRPAGKLALPSLKKPHLPALGGLGACGGALGGAKRPGSSLAAAVQRVAALSDSDDDFK